MVASSVGFESEGDMIYKKYWVLLAAICAALVTTHVAMAAAEVDRAFMNDLTETIAKARTGESSTVRTEAAERLSKLTKSVNPKDIDDKTLSDLASLLDTHEDSVRAWVAVSLGNLGPRAKVAAPKMLKILPEVDCLRVSLSSAPAIRVALKRMGVKVPPLPDCEKSK